MYHRNTFPGVGRFSNDAPVNVTDAGATLTLAHQQVHYTLYNSGSNTVYYGGPGVTAANGIPLEPNSGVALDFSGDIHLITAATLTSTVRVLRGF